MKKPIPWQDLPKWVPGKIGLSSETLGWKNVAMRSYSYDGQDVIVPAMQDFLLVGYRAGVTPMQRRFDGRWRKERVSPGAVSFLTRAQAAHWQWDEKIDVIHIYLSGDLVKDVAGEVFDCAVSDVALEDVLRTVDPMISNAMGAFAAEAQAQGLGGDLYVDALSRGLIIHLLRHFAVVRTQTKAAPGTLSPQHKRIISDYIEAHLAEALDLTTLGQVLGMSPCHFARQFKASFGRPPYAYVMEKRLARARDLLASGTLAIKEIAADCGFSDQAHLTRLFRRTFGSPPSKFRRDNA